MNKRINSQFSEEPSRKKTSKRKKPCFRLKRRTHRKRKHIELKRMAAEVVDSEPENMIERLKSFEGTEFEVMRYYIEKKCEVCLTSQSQNNIVLCDRCDDAYHIHCLDPPLEDVPRDLWLCEVCRHEIEEDSHIEREFPSECYRCGGTLHLEKYTFIRDIDILTEQTTEFQLALQKRNQGFQCRHCSHVFHYSCLSERVNSVNCSECEQRIRSRGPKSQAEFVEYIQRSQEYDEEFFRKYELMPEGPDRSAKTDDSLRLKPIWLRLPKPLTNPYSIIKASLSLYYALATQHIRFIDQQIYCTDNARVADNNTETVSSRFLQLSLRDEEVFKEFKQMSSRGYFGPLEIVENKTRGFFVKALDFIPAGTIISEYVGEVVNSRKSLEWKTNDSIFSLLRTSHSRTSLDICPYRFANISKFLCGINNSHRGSHWLENVQTMKFKFEGRARVLFYAKRNIQPGDTLFIDYNAGGFEEYPTDHFT